MRGMPVLVANLGDMPHLCGVNTPAATASLLQQQQLVHVYPITGALTARASAGDHAPMVAAAQPETLLEFPA